LIISLRSASFGLHSSSYDPTRRRDKSAWQERGCQGHAYHLPI